EPHRSRYGDGRVRRLHVPAVRPVGLPYLPALHGGRSAAGPRRGGQTGPARRAGCHHRPALILM
ncbi:hypothetical protein, partial [Arthrobacter sp. DR-2P]